MSDAGLRCGYAVVDKDGEDGEEGPCDRPATGWRWYQDVGEHEDLLERACDWHANEGGRRLHEAEAKRDHWKAICVTWSEESAKAKYDEYRFGRAASAEAEALDRAEAAEALHRDLVSRLGFGNNITEPMADNDTVVAWFEQQGQDANEWHESQLWRGDCYVKGHPDDEDCWECDPSLRLEAAEAKVRAVEALQGWLFAELLTETRAGRPVPDLGRNVLAALRAALDAAGHGETR